MEGTQRWAFTLFPENPTNSSSLRILVGSMDSVCGIRGSTCMESILGKPEEPTHGLPFTLVREQPPLPDSYQPLHHLPGPAPSFTSRLSICMSPTQPILLPLPEHPSLLGTPGGSFQSQLKCLLLLLPWEPSLEPLKRIWIGVPCG